MRATEIHKWSQVHVGGGVSLQKSGVREAREKLEGGKERCYRDPKGEELAK